MRTLQTQAQWCQRAQWVLGVSLALMVSAFYTFIYRPNSQRLADLHDQIASKQSSLSSNKARAEVLPTVRAEVFAMQHRLEQFDEEVPADNELSPFIRNITELSDQAGLRTKWNVHPGTAQHDEHELFAQWPITMTFQGNFLNVCEFLRSVEKMHRLTRVSGLKMTGMEKGKSGMVEVELSMNIYYLEG